MQFFKYHALGNDYLVLPKSQNITNLLPEHIQLICHRHFGIGSDGILLESLPSQNGDFALKIFNPDGSEAEKSGNGLRIFSRYLFDNQLVKSEPFTIETLGGKVRCQILCPETQIIVEMGQIHFLQEDTLKIQNDTYPFFSASIGNPHCIIPHPNISENLIKKIGPEIETHPYFPNRTNVQLMEIINESRIKIEIWERGAGYTLASGSSACATAATAYKMGHCNKSIIVQMPGGELQIDIGKENHITMTGPTTFVGEFIINNSLLFKKNLHIEAKIY